MKYIDNILMPGEQIVYKTRLHKTTLVNGFVWGLFALIFFILSLSANPYFLIGFAITFLISLSAYIVFYTSEFGITNKRVIMKTGFIRRTSFELLLHKVEGIMISQGLLDRTFNMGTIIISGTGGTKNAFKNIIKPIEFRKNALEQIEMLQNAKPK